MFGDGVLFIVAVMVIEEFANLDLTDFSPEAAKLKFVEGAKKIDPMKISHRLLTSHEDYEYYTAKKKEFIV